MRMIDPEAVLRCCSNKTRGACSIMDTLRLLTCKGCSEYQYRGNPLRINVIMDLCGRKVQFML